MFCRYDAEIHWYNDFLLLLFVQKNCLILYMNCERSSFVSYKTLSPAVEVTKEILPLANRFFSFLRLTANPILLSSNGLNTILWLSILVKRSSDRFDVSSVIWSGPEDVTHELLNKSNSSSSKQTRLPEKRTSISDLSLISTKSSVLHISTKSSWSSKGCTALSCSDRHKIRRCANCLYSSTGRDFLEAFLLWNQIGNIILDKLFS